MLSVICMTSQLHLCALQLYSLVHVGYYTFHCSLCVIKKNRIRKETSTVGSSFPPPTACLLEEPRDSSRLSSQRRIERSPCSGHVDYVHIQTSNFFIASLHKLLATAGMQFQKLLCFVQYLSGKVWNAHWPWASSSLRICEPRRR